MTIRKTGGADGRVTAAGVDPSAMEDPEMIAPVAARQPLQEVPGWGVPDERELADENKAADGE